VVAKQIAGSGAVAYTVPFCGGAFPVAPSRDKQQPRGQTYLINIKPGGEAEAFARAQQIPGVRQAWPYMIPKPCPKNMS
jgi:hypothetical protein